MMVLLVTGASGHVGQEIVRQAANSGRRVLAINRSGQPSQDSEPQPNLTWAACDLCDRDALSRLIDRYPISSCIHGAAVSNEAYARPAPHAAIATNVGATANLLEAARVSQWDRFLFISTGSVYQCRADTISPILEDEPPAPQNIYSTTKTNAEMLVRMYRTEFQLSAASIRISWVFGPTLIADAPTRGPIPSYLLRCLRGETISEAGGDFAASFTYVGDVAAGMLAAAEAPKLAHDIYHLGPGRNFSVRDVANAVVNAVPGAEIELGSGTAPWTTFTAMRGPLAGSRLFEDVGFEPAHSLEQGILAYAEWIRANRHLWA